MPYGPDKEIRLLREHGNTIPITVQFVTPTTYPKINTAKGLSPEAPDLDAEHVQKLTDAEMFSIIKNGVRFTGMPGWDLPDGRVWQLVLLIRQFANESTSPP